MANIYSTGHLGGAVPPRQAESTDTRQAIREHERDQPDREQREQRQNNDSVFDQNDEAVVSVDALRVFLENFIRTADGDMTEKTENTRENVDIAQIDENPAPPVQTPYAAHAARAYQSAAHAGKPDLSGAHFDQNQARNLGLQGENMRMVLVLIEDLKALTQRGIHHLKVERADDFLQSLLMAVEKAKN